MKNAARIILIIFFSVSILIMTNIAVAGEFRGEVILQVADDFKGNKAERFTVLYDKLSDRFFELNFPEGKGPAWLKTGAMATVNGELINGKLVVSGIAAMDGETSTSSTSQQYQVAALTGNVRPLIIRVNDPTHSAYLSRSTLSNYMYSASNSVADMFEKNSNGVQQWNGDANEDGQFDIVDAQISTDVSASCSYGTWSSEANQYLQSINYDMSPYTHRIYILPSASKCGWAGLAYINGGTSYARAGGAFVLAHELGHNFGLRHASVDSNNDGRIDSEYGDHSCFMGNGSGLKFANSPHTYSEGWLNGFGGAVSDFGTGTHTIYALDDDPSTVAGPQIGRMQIGTSSDYYYFSVRRAKSYETNLSTAYTRGVNIHRRSGSSNSRFIRAIAPGEEWVDTANGVRIAVSNLAGSNASATFSINSDIPCTPGTLEFVHGATDIGISPTGTTRFRFGIKNNDFGPCGTTKVDLSVVASPGLTTTFDASTLFVAPGQTIYTYFNADYSALTSNQSATITAQDTDGVDPLHASISTTLNLTIDTEAPTAPANLVASSAKRGTVNLSWEASSDNVGVSYYEIYRDSGAGFQRVRTSSTTSTSDNPGSGDHQYYVIAVDAVGNKSSQSNIAVPEAKGNKGNGGSGNGKGKGNTK